jgi:hypothetical protein
MYVESAVLVVYVVQLSKQKEGDESGPLMGNIQG